jgi:ribosome-associated heat shock protein Hsp15
MTDKNNAVRLDKWLWAARFFKTRRLAHEAIDGGKVHVSNQKCKPGKKISQGVQITISQGHLQKTVIVKALSEVRKSATIAQNLYEETSESIIKREKEAQLRKQSALIPAKEKPGKKQRRELLKVKRNQSI